MNYFNPESAAARYAKGRPDFHDNTIAQVKDFLQLTRSINKALDIACGTGLSTKALLTIAEHVYGTDTSEHMLNNAVKNDAIRYRLAAAEQQPFDNKIFDLITVCSGVHWFNIDAFLNEANRLLKDDAWLILYDNFFIADMELTDGFKDWYLTTYLEKYPAPKRNESYDWSNENLQHKQFALVHESNFTNAVDFTKSELVLYFTTQSNVIATVESGHTTYNEVEEWLHKELSAFFTHNDTCKTIHYGNWIKYIQKTN
ncbi:MAG: class I SAM-dependent methyltransferase [Bacteroidota bacterium]